MSVQTLSGRHLIVEWGWHVECTRVAAERHPGRLGSSSANGSRKSTAGGNIDEPKKTQSHLRPGSLDGRPTGARRLARIAEEEKKRKGD